jgi:hypothetical protein
MGAPTSVDIPLFGLVECQFNQGGIGLQSRLGIWQSRGASTTRPSPRRWRDDRRIRSIGGKGAARLLQSPYSAAWPALLARYACVRLPLLSLD